MKTLIIEFQTSGHYPEYLKHVLFKINELNLTQNFYIYVNPALKPHLKNLKGKDISKRIFYFDRSLSEKYSNCVNTKQMSGIILNQIFALKKKINFEHVLFLNMNLVLRNLNILNPFIKLPFSFSGVYMNSPYRIREKNDDKLLRVKRELPLKLLMKNKNCKQIFLFNDAKGAEFYSKWSKKIRYINEPVRIALPSKLNICNYHKIDRSDLTFLQIGELAAYKGTRDILDSILNLKQNIIEHAHFLFIGRINQDIKKNISEIINSKLQDKITTRDEYIFENDFMSYIKQSHVVIIANKNVENSSGILHHCLANNKVIIAPKKGYFKEVLENYDAALLYDRKFTLKDSIEYAFKHHKQLEIKAQNFDSLNFIKENSGDKYAQTLLDSL